MVMRFSGVFLLLLIAGGCVVHQGDIREAESPPRVGIQSVSEYVYTPDDWPEQLTATVFRPEGEGPHPGILLVHGGGWRGGSPDDISRIARRYARSGFVAVNVSYRFAPAHLFPAQLHDVQQAMHWLHGNADELDLDAERIAAMGYSAGAHLVSLMALVAGQGGELDTPHGGRETRPFAVIAGGTPTDLRKWETGRLVEGFLGGTQAEKREAYRLASPVVHVHAEAPPFFLFHGRMDRLVPLDHAEDFSEILNQHALHHELYMQRLRGHISSFLTRQGAMRESIRFLWAELEALPQAQ